jgi:hypothetical protein
MNKFFKRYFEVFLILLSIIFIALSVIVFIKVINILVVNLEKALNVPEVKKDIIDFNINDAYSILKKRNLVQ